MGSFFAMNSLNFRIASDFVGRFNADIISVITLFMLSVSFDRMTFLGNLLEIEICSIFILLLISSVFTNCKYP